MWPMKITYSPTTVDVLRASPDTVSSPTHLSHSTVFQWHWVVRIIRDEMSRYGAHNPGYQRNRLLRIIAVGHNQINLPNWTELRPSSGWTWSKEVNVWYSSALRIFSAAFLNENACDFRSLFRQKMNDVEEYLMLGLASLIDCLMKISE